MDIFSLIRNGQLTELSTLLSNQPDQISARDERGSTPLLLAAYLGNTAATDLLVKAGADLNEMASTGTALMGASFKGEIAVARQLLEAGADPNVRHEMGLTALGFARQFGQQETEKLLLEYGAGE